MSDDVELDDFFGRYDDIYDDNIQAIITSKREYFELASGIKDERPKDGGYYNHQIFVDRLMEMVNRVIVAHETGTGKSFLIGAMGMSAFKRYRRGRGIKHIYVLVSGPTQKADMTNMLVCRSTGGHFLNEKITDAVNDRSARQAATNSLKQWFTVMTYHSFAKILESLTNDQIEQEYSDCEFILDELHNFRIDSNIDPMDYTPKQSDKEFDKIMINKNILRLGMYSRRIKMAGLSATLTVNDVNEAGPIFNLILPPERRFPIGFDFVSKLGTEEGEEEIEWHLRAHVSYVRAFDTGAIPTPQGNPIPRDENDQDPIKVSAYIMSKKQTKSYIDAWNNDVKEGKVENGWRPNTRQAANGIFPDGSWGNEGFNVYITRDEKRSWWRMNKDLADAFGNLKTLAELSIKTRALIDIINNTEGVVSVYMHQSSGSGIVYVSLALESQGYPHFAEMTSVFTNTGSRVSYCSNISTSRQIKSTFKKSPRLALITDGTPSAQVPVILDVMYSYENKNGEYVKVFMFTDRAKEGISVNHGKAHVQFAGVWRDTDQIQAGNRIFRTNSHEVLINEEIDRLIQEEELDPDEAKSIAKIEVPTYKLASIPDAKVVEKYSKTDLDSVDILMYGVCDEKSREAKRLYRLIKRIATDCHIHKKRNVRTIDKDFTAICDYIECDYECYTPKILNKDGSEYHDYSTYDIFYMNQIVDRIRNNVLKYFQVNGSGTAEMIKNAIISQFDVQTEEISHDYREKYIVIVLSDVIIRQTTIIDRFGYTAYINEHNGLYYTTHEYKSDIVNRSLAYYGHNPIINKTEPYISLFNKMEASRMSPEIEVLRNISEDIPDYRKTIFNMLNAYSFENQAQVIENAIISKIKGKESLYVETILDIYNKVIFQLHEPKKMIEATANKASTSVSGNIVPVGEFDQNKKSPIVYLNSIYTHAVNLTKYSETSDIYKAKGRIRMFKTTENKWRDPNDYERVVYALYIQQQLENDREKMEREHPIYGIIFNNGDFKIRDSKEKDSSKTRHDGLKAKHWLPYDLIKIMLEIGVPVPNNVYNKRVSITNKSLERNVNVNIMIKYLKTKISQGSINIEEWDDDRIVFFYLWFKHIEGRKLKTEMVNIIRDYMSKEGMIIYLGKR